MAIYTIRVFVLIVCSLIVLANHVGSEQAHAGHAPTPHVTPTLIADVKSIQPGKPFTVGLRLQLEEHWHVYWYNPGDTGLETRIKWTAPTGFALTPTQWPAPTRISLQHMVNFGYEHEVIWLTTVTPPDGLAIGEDAHITVKADWLVCKENCLPGSATLTITLPVAESAIPDHGSRALLRAYESHIPQPADQLGWITTASLLPSAIEITLEPKDPKTHHPGSATFFPDHTSLIDNAAKQTTTCDGRRLRVRIPRSPQRELLAPPELLQGVLVADSAWPPAATHKAMRISIPWSKQSPDIE